MNSLAFQVLEDTIKARRRVLVGGEAQIDIMSLEQEIAAWDGKSSDYIREIYESNHRQPDFVDNIIKLTIDATYQKGSTWLLKVWLESGNKLEKRQIRKIYDLLNKLEHWEAKLHVLQRISFMPIEQKMGNKVNAFLRKTRTDQNKFIRAWSYNGYYELAKQHPEYLNETKQLFEMAERDEAASVKARIRNIMKKGF